MTNPLLEKRIEIIPNQKPALSLAPGLNNSVIPNPNPSSGTQQFLLLPQKKELTLKGCGVFSGNAREHGAAIA